MSFNTADVDKVIDAIEALIEDVDFRANPHGTWTGLENRDKVRNQLRAALVNLIIKGSQNEGVA